jgi:hypothetical protein
MSKGQTAGEWKKCLGSGKHLMTGICDEQFRMIADVCPDYFLARGDRDTMPVEEQCANLNLIAEAGTVANQVGLWPRELAAQRDAYIKALRVVLNHADGFDVDGRRRDTGDDNACGRNWHTVIEIARAALARAGGKA